MSIQSFSHLPEHYTLGEEFSNQYGVRCYPATDTRTGMRYVAKVHTFPYSPSITEAFLLSNAFEDENEINAYYHDISKDLCRQAAILNAMSHSAYFAHIPTCEMVRCENMGYEVLLLSPYYTTLATLFRRATLNQQQIVELGISLCRALSICREAGFLYTGIKPENIFVTGNGQFMVGDIGFIPLSSLPYAALPLKRYTVYTPADCHDCYCRLSENLDIYGVGVVLYQACCGGEVPDTISLPPRTENKTLSEIIMTACQLASEARWKEPADMEAALLSCQENTANQ